MSSLDRVWQVEFLGNDAHSWAVAVVIFFATLIVLSVIRSFVSARRRRWAEQEASPDTAHLRPAHHAIDLTTLDRKSVV